MKVSILLLFLGLVLAGCSNLPTPLEIELNTDPIIYGGDGFVCYGEFDKGECVEGYECYNVSQSPYVIGMCFREEEVRSENFTPQGYNIDKIIREERLREIEESFE